jgi:hypothetical protein
LAGVGSLAGENSGRDGKTALQPNQKTGKMTDISCKSHSNGIDTGRPVTEEHDHA